MNYKDVTRFLYLDNTSQLNIYHSTVISKVPELSSQRRLLKYSVTTLLDTFYIFFVSSLKSGNIISISPIIILNVSDINILNPEKYLYIICSLSLNSV